jgi:photosystem II stability/assembly factor-like uncharacterized protein
MVSTSRSVGLAFSLAGMMLTVQETAAVDAKNSVPPSPTYAPALLKALRYRGVGPYRGGRSTAVAGVPSDIFTYYMGTSGGGVWKTADAGTSWRNVSDGYFEVGSIGAVAVAASDPNVVYAGTGSACPRGNVSPGIGVYKSTDAGATWKHVGLRDAGQIGKLAVHPTNPDVVYVAALGHIFGSNAQRGVFRSRNGGATWERVLFLDAETGAVDIKMDSSNPRILYAAFWRAERKPWTLISGSATGGIYRTTDGGDTWNKLSEGLPKGLTGRIGIAVSPANPQRVWAVIEGERKDSGFDRDESGLYRSDDGGRTWGLVNGDPLLHQRPWYYHHLVADPQDADTLYHVGDSFWKSVDGGKSFETIDVPHVDNHDLWINPHDPKIMIEANDGGANVTINGGKTWSTQLNQPTAEIYRVTLDEEFPYRLYGGQQDASTISVPSRAQAAEGITLQHWTAVGGGEMGPVAVDPRDPNIIYAGGNISRMDRSTGQIRRILDYPQYWMGQPARDLRFRFQSEAPIRLSPHDPGVVYAASQYVHRSRNGGQTWELISPDLTRHDDSKLGPSGGPLTRDITSVETYCTILAIEESARVPGLLWAGSDDGLVHVSRNGGQSWVDVTPRGMPEWGTVNTIDLSRHDPGRALIAVHRYKLDDFAPYIFRTNDYGATWQLISKDNGIPGNHFVRVVREDPDRPGLLYAGTEFGIYVSFDDGGRWQPLQLNLPVTPVTDLAVHGKDLAVSTQGRGFWILDDLTPLHQLTKEVAQADAYLFKPRPTYRIEGGESPAKGYMGEDRLMGAAIENFRQGENPPPGVTVFYNFKATPNQDVKLEVLDAAGSLIRAFSSKTKDDALRVEEGLNRFAWDLSYPAAEIIPGSRLDGYTGGPRALPGHYRVRLTVGAWSRTQDFDVLQDPRSKATAEDLRQQFSFLLSVRDAISKSHAAVRTIQSLRQQLDDLGKRLSVASPPTEGNTADGWRQFLDEVRGSRHAIDAKLDALEDTLRQKRARVWQDTENFRPLLDDQMAFVADLTIAADTRPTDAAYQRFQDLEGELNRRLSELEAVTAQAIPRFNALIREAGVGAIIVPASPAAAKPRETQE